MKKLWVSLGAFLVLVACGTNNVSADLADTKASLATQSEDSINYEITSTNNSVNVEALFDCFADAEEALSWQNSETPSQYPMGFEIDLGEEYTLSEITLDIGEIPFPDHSKLIVWGRTDASSYTKVRLNPKEENTQKTYSLGEIRARYVKLTFPEEKNVFNILELDLTQSNGDSVPKICKALTSGNP